MKKVLLWVTMSVLVCVGGGVLAKDVIARIAVTTGVKAITGLNLHIQRMHVGIVKSTMDIQEFVLENPNGFPDKVMMNLPEIFVDYDLGAFVGGKIHLREVRLNLKEFLVERDRQGRLNLDALKVVQQSKNRAAAPKEVKPIHGKEMQIDLLQLKVGKVIYKDYSVGEHPLVQEFNIGLESRYENITDAQALVGLIVSQALMRTSLDRIANLDVTGLASQVAGQAGNAAHTLTETGKGVVGGATGAVKKGSDALKKLLSPE